MTIRTSDVLGATVVDRQGRRLGRVTDLLLDGPRPTSICYALVDIERQPGGDTRTVAVPWSVLQPDGGDRRLVLDASRESLRRLRSFGSP